MPPTSWYDWVHSTPEDEEDNEQREDNDHHDDTLNTNGNPQEEQTWTYDDLMSTSELTTPFQIEEACIYWFHHANLPRTHSLHWQTPLIAETLLVNLTPPPSNIPHCHPASNPISIHPIYHSAFLILFSHGADDPDRASQILDEAEQLIPRFGEQRLESAAGVGERVYRGWVGRVEWAFRVWVAGRRVEIYVAARRGKGWPGRGRERFGGVGGR